MIAHFAILIIGVAVLWGGAELLIRNSSSLARSMGISPVIIGLTVVSIGTSLPEFVVSLTAALQNTMGISIGNIIGSNIANIGLILGLGAVIRKLEVKRSWVTKEVPVMIGFTFIFSFFAYTGHIITRVEGLVLLLCLILFLGYISRTSWLQIQDFRSATTEPGTAGTGRIKGSVVIKNLGFSILGLALLVIGSRLTVTSGVEIARTIGVNETVIGLTLIAVGTSLPELAATIVGVVQKETDIVVGNIVGSNIFNLLFIGGLVPVIRPIPIDPRLFLVEFPFLILLSILVWPIMRYQWNIRRGEGILLLTLYVLFIGLVFKT